MQSVFRSPVTSQDENLQIVLTCNDSDWILTVQNRCGQHLKRLTVVFYPKPPVFVSKEMIKIGTLLPHACSQAYRLSLRINHQALVSRQREIIEPEKAAINISSQFRINLLQTLNTYMNLDDLKTLCFHLNIEEENVPGDIRERKAAELISLCQRKRRIPELLETCRFLNPGAPWPELFSTKEENNKDKKVESFEDVVEQFFFLDFKAVYMVGDLTKMQQFQQQLLIELA